MQNEFEAKLKEWVEIPSVSAAPEHRADIEKIADNAVAYIRECGGTADKIRNPWQSGGYWRVSFPGRDRPTVTVYNHLDVQPANEPQWKRPPFVFHSENQTVLWAWHDRRQRASPDGFLWRASGSSRRSFPSTSSFIWELEEEIGSPNFEHFIKANLQCATNGFRRGLRHDLDCAREAGSRLWSAWTCPFRLLLETGTKDVHSGTTGGAARNPIGELCQVIAECYDARTGKVKIPGFYKDVAKPTRQELASFLSSGFNVNHFRRAHELKHIRSGSASDVMQRLWTQPTFEVHGMVGGYTGTGVKTAIAPAAEAKLSMRLVPNQNPDKVFALVRKFVKQRNPDVQVIPESFLSPFLGPREGPYIDAATDAMRFAFGKKPAFVREGGSIGAVVTMQKHLKVPIVFLGLSLPEHGYHAPNENYDWEQASGGMRMFERYFENLARGQGSTTSQ